MQLAKQYRVPPYIVCDDRTLSDMARRRPVTMDGLMTVHGMGAVKAGKYGEAFLRVIRDYDNTRTTLTVPRGGQGAKPLTAGEKTQLRREYLAGTSIARMASSLGRTEEEIRTALQQMGLII